MVTGNEGLLLLTVLCHEMGLGDPQGDPLLAHSSGSDCCEAMVLWLESVVVRSQRRGSVLMQVVGLSEGQVPSWQVLLWPFGGICFTTRPQAP